MTVDSVPFFRPSIGAAEIDEVTECLRSGWLTTGPRTEAFERAFADFIGGGVQAIAVNSATAAMHLGLEALDIRPGDEVILPTLTFTATAEVVRYLGAEPVLVDVDAETLCITPEAVEGAIGSRTRAVMPVHFAGQPCDMATIRRIAREHDLKVLDDAAHALPAMHAGKLIGDCGADATAFSFYANKTMTTGEGGMLVTKDPALAARARVMRLHGIDRDVFNRFSDTRASWLYDVVAPGFKYNMTDIASALGLVQFRRLDEFLKQRSRLASRYDEGFADLPLIRPSRAAEGDLHSRHLYIVQLTPDAPVSRDDFIGALQQRRIGCSVHYRPLHQLTVWAESARGRAFPAADAYFRNCVSLPLFMAMRDDEQERVIEVVREILSA